MNTARADAQKYGLGAVVVAVVVLLLFWVLNNNSDRAHRAYIGAPTTASDSANAGTAGSTMSK